MNHFVAGVLGAFAPEALRLYRARDRQQRVTTFYLAVTAIYVLVAGGVTAALTGGGNIPNALYTGMTMPLLLDAGTKTVIRPRPPRTTTIQPTDVEQIEAQGVAAAARLRLRAMLL